MKTLALFVSIGAVTMAMTSIPARADGDADLIKSAESAAPAAIASGAAIYGIDDKGNMKTLREGKNGWWCMPDSPTTPGPDPMCGDANAMEWAMAWAGLNESVESVDRVKPGESGNQVEEAETMKEATA